jgi:hypothetical protein
MFGYLFNGVHAECTNPTHYTFFRYKLFKGLTMTATAVTTTTMATATAAAATSAKSTT